MKSLHALRVFILASLVTGFPRVLSPSRSVKEWRSHVDSQHRFLFATRTAEGEDFADGCVDSSNREPVEQNELTVSKAQAFTLLTGVTVLWGTQHAVIKLAIESSGHPAELTLARFGIAALLFSPWLPLPSFVSSSRGSSADRTWLIGAELGCWMFLGYALQAVALQTTTASRSAFLLYLNVKLVPFFAWLCLGRDISALTWVSAATALVGTALLANDGAPPCVGDAWSVLAACASAAFILRLEAAVMPPDQRQEAAAVMPQDQRHEASAVMPPDQRHEASAVMPPDQRHEAAAVMPPDQRHEDTAAGAPERRRTERLDPRSVTSCSLFTVAALSLAWAAFEAAGTAVASSSSSSTPLLPPPPSSLTSFLDVAEAAGGILSEDLSATLSLDGSSNSGLAVVYLAVVATALTNWMQAVGQSVVPAEQAALIYALDPLWGAVFAAALCGDRLGPMGVLGGALVLSAALATSTADARASEEAEEEEREAAAKGRKEEEEEAHLGR